MTDLTDSQVELLQQFLKATPEKELETVAGLPELVNRNFVVMEPNSKFFVITVPGLAYLEQKGKLVREPKESLEGDAEILRQLITQLTIEIPELNRVAYALGLQSKKIYDLVNRVGSISGVAEKIKVANTPKPYKGELPAPRTVQPAEEVTISPEAMKDVAAEYLKHFDMARNAEAITAGINGYFKRGKLISPEKIGALLKDDPRFEKVRKNWKLKK